MGIEHIVVVETVLQHLGHAAVVIGHVAVGSHQEGVFVGVLWSRQALAVSFVFRKIDVRHLHTVLHACA